MKIVNRLLVFLIPALRIRPEWQSIWAEKDRRSFLVSTPIVLFALCITYIGHFFFVDIPLKKEPIELWAYHRFGIALFAALVASFYYSSWAKRASFFRIPLIAVAFVCTYMQGQTMLWRAEVPYIYSILIPVLATIAIRTNVFSSVFFLMAAFILEIPAWLARPDELPYIVSAGFFGFVAVVILRSRMSVQVSAFISEMENLKTNEKLISTQKEINDQIKAFLPREIYSRFIEALNKRSSTTLLAIDSVLRCRPCVVSCIYSDIRSFTRMTKRGGEFLYEAAIPNIRICTGIVEDHRGIPKHIGDSIFAYFDCDDPEDNIKKAIYCGVDLIQRTRDLNENMSEQSKVNRYILISYGEAIVGNIGAHDASREITVMGNPANILSRIDPLTKHLALKNILKDSSLILTDKAMEAARRAFPDVKARRINLAEMKIRIRDFPEEVQIFAIPAEEIINRKFKIKDTECKERKAV